MSHPLYFESIAKQLHRTLPAEYVNRIVGELTDHAEDATLRRNSGRHDDSKSDHSAVLGDVDTVCSSVVSQYCQQSLIGRHPWLQRRLR